MKSKIQIRPQRVSDARRFFEILNNPNFKYFNVQVKSVQDERSFLKGNAAKRRSRREFNFAILFDGKLVGGIGVRVDAFRRFQGEIGYFIDEGYWGRGITTKALKLAEQFAFRELKLKRIEVIAMPENKASVRVAEKCGYQREGLLRKKVSNRGKLVDAVLLAKVR